MKKQLKDLQHNSFNETSQIRSLTSKTQGDLLKQHQQANAEFMNTSETRNKLKEKRKR